MQRSRKLQPNPLSSGLKKHDFPSFCARERRHKRFMFREIGSRFIFSPAAASFATLAQFLGGWPRQKVLCQTLCRFPRIKNCLAALEWRLMIDDWLSLDIFGRPIVAEINENDSFCWIGLGLEFFSMCFAYLRVFLPDIKTSPTPLNISRLLHSARFATWSWKSKIYLRNDWTWRTLQRWFL